MDILFTGTPGQIRKDIIDYLGDTAPGRISGELNAPQNVTKQVIYEPVKTSQRFLNEYYIVTVVNDTTPVACTCKDFHYTIRRKRDRGIRHPTHVCKHMRQAGERHRRFR